MYTCPKCGNKDQNYIAYRNGVPYCRKCISFSGQKANVERVTPGIELKLGYPLSKDQEQIADNVLSCVKIKKDVLINAVTGAGKTELVYKAMEYVLKNGGHVGFATPRKDVVIDLVPRISLAFPKAKTIAVYGGHTSNLKGDIVVITTHQLYRYDHFFDLLIVDEIDAFPYIGDKTLEHFMNNSIKGSKILLSATPPKEALEDVQKSGVVYNLDKRYHGSPLPTPVFINNGLNKYLKALLLIRKYQKLDKPLFVFVPTIEIGKKLYKFLSPFLTKSALVYSYEKERAKKIEDFKSGKLKCLITTTILERGVTVKDLQVIVFDSDNPLFNEASLIQIAGRVGRKIGATTGDVIFMGERNKRHVQEAIATIKATNRRALLPSMP